MKTDDIKIIATRVRKIDLNIASEISNSLTLNVEWVTEIRASEDKDKRIMLLVNLKVYDESHEKFFVEMNGESIFEFKEKPDDLMKVSKEECLPMAQIKLSEILDNILLNVGFAKLNVAKDIGLK